MCRCDKLSFPARIRIARARFNKAMAHELNSDNITRLMQESRDRTRELLALVISESDLRREPAPGFRPILWHLGHVGAFEEYWILQKLKGDPGISEAYGRIFDPVKTPRE